MLQISVLGNVDQKCELLGLHVDSFMVISSGVFKINRGFNSEVQFIFIELEGSAGVKFKLSNPTKEERVNEEIQSADRRSTIPD